MASRGKFDIKYYTKCRMVKSYVCQKDYKSWKNHLLDNIIVSGLFSVLWKIYLRASNGRWSRIWNIPLSSVNPYFLPSWINIGYKSAVSSSMSFWRSYITSDCYLNFKFHELLTLWALNFNKIISPCLRENMHIH